MKIKTVIVSGYPMFREGLKKVLGPGFVVTSYFDDVPELLAASTQAELAILDEEASKELAILKSKRPSLTILKLSLEDNKGYLYESVNNTSSDAILNTVQSLTNKLTVICNTGLLKMRKD